MSSLSKAASILSCFSAENTGLTVSGVSQHLNLPKSSVSRLMKEMAELGLLQREQGGRGYELGCLLFQLGSIYQMRFDLLEIVKRIVRELVRRTGCTGYIGILDAGEIVAIRKHLGEDAVSYRIEVGHRYPITSLSFGKAILARRSDEEIQGFFARHPNARPARMSAFLTEIACIRSQGWAEATMASPAGAHGLGVAIVSPLTNQVVGYSLAFHADPFSTQKRDEIAMALVNSARHVAALTHDAYWLNT